jgi:hypothetical protein
VIARLVFAALPLLGLLALLALAGLLHLPSP